MSVDKVIQVPRYLVENDEYVNESQSPEFPLVFRPGGYVVKDRNSQLDGNHHYISSNNWFEVDEEFEEFTLEITHLASQTVTFFHYLGDNKTTSNTSLRIGRTAFTFYFWRTYSQHKLYSYPEPDGEGYITSTVLKTKNSIQIYQNGKYVKGWSVTNRFTSKDIRLAEGTFSFKRFAFTPHVIVPAALHHNTKNSILLNKEDNLKLVDLADDTYDARSYDEKHITDVYSYGNWIFSKDSEGHIVAFNRPRGVDSGVTITAVTYDLSNDKVKFELDNDTSIELQVPKKSQTVGETIPEGTGILSSEGKHKPIVYQGNVEFKREYEGKNKVHFFSKGNSTNSIDSLETKGKLTAPLDYSKRLILRDLRTTESKNYPWSSSNHTVDYDNWQDYPMQVRTTAPEIFEPNLNGDAVLPPGKYVLVGKIKRNFFTKTRGLHGFRLTDGENDYMCKLYSLDRGNELADAFYFLEFEFYEPFTVTKTVTVKVQELLTKSYDSGKLDLYPGVEQGKLEIFKV